MNLTVNGDVVRYVTQLAGDASVRFEVTKLREEHTGVHGLLRIIHNTTVLAQTILNIEKDDQRAKLVNSAWEFQFGSWRTTGTWTHPDGSLYGRLDLKHQLDQFCGKAWDFLTNSYGTEILEHDLSTEPPPLRFLLDPYLIERGGTLVFASGGSGKSYLVQAWAICIASDLAHIWPVTQAPVLYINLERSDSELLRREYYLAAALGLPAQRTGVKYLHMRGQGLTAALRRAEPWVKDHPRALVILDSVSRAGLGGSLIDDEPANKFIDMMGSLGATWLGIGHTSKASGDRIFGSVHYENGADIAIKLSSEEKDTKTGFSLGMSLQITKVNNGRKTKPANYALEWNGTGNLSNIRAASEVEFPDLFLDRKAGRTERVVDYLRAIGSATQAQIVEATGLDTPAVSKMMNLADGQFVRLPQKQNGAYLYGLRAEGS
jgi:hypothetical protein|tara:strand:- start:364 stop:1662 length:1299 start_codon:yes stop_codon:yes gene_type:complete